MSSSEGLPLSRGFFPSRDGLKLYHEVWPARTEPLGTLLFLHGYSEHCGRYRKVVPFFTERGFDCLLFDCRGHGQSAGRRGDIRRFDEYLGDLASAIALGAQRASGPLFLVAHSHGGLIALRYLLEEEIAPAPLGGLALTSPYFGLEWPLSASKRLLGRVAARIMPSLALPSGIPTEFLSHDQEVLEAHRTDPWVFRFARARWFDEATRAQAFCFEHAGRLRLPVLVLAAGEDRIADTEQTRRVFERFPPGDKRIMVYPGLYHEVLFEQAGAQVCTDLWAWLDERLRQGASVLGSAGTVAALKTS